MAKTINKEEAKAVLENEVAILFPIQEEMNELAQVPEVVKYLQAAKKFEDAETMIRDSLKKQMIEADIKSVKGEWGSIGLTERTTFSADDITNVPAKFTKKALDNEQIRAKFKLSGSLPKGVDATTSVSITIKLKKTED